MKQALRGCVLLTLCLPAMVVAQSGASGPLPQWPQRPGPAPAPATPPGGKLLPGRSPTNSTATTPARDRSTPQSATLWGTVAALGVVAVALFFAARWLRTHGPTSLRGLPVDAVDILGQRVLSRGVSVHLIRCGSRALLVGVGPDGVRTLSEVTDPVEVDLLVGACRRRDEQSLAGGQFGQLWQRQAESGGERTGLRVTRATPGLSRSGTGPSESSLDAA